MRCLRLIITFEAVETFFSSKLHIFRHSQNFFDKKVVSLYFTLIRGVGSSLSDFIFRMKNIAIKLFNALAWLFVGLTASALTPQEAVELFVSEPGVDPEKTAVLICDLNSGETLGAWNEKGSLVPASIQKSVTTATLLQLLDKDWRFETDVCIDGDVDGGVLEGNIIIVGSGDPTINSTKEPLSPDFVGEIVKALGRLEVDSVAGGVIIDESVFAPETVPSSWQSGDLSHAYGTGVHGFNFQNNASGKRSVSDPSAVFIGRLKNAFRSAGIRLAGVPMHQGERKSIFTHRSASLEEIMRSCMMRSDNLYAEAMFRMLPVVKKGKSTFASAAKSMTDFWRKHKADFAGVEIIDGSGLSRSNRMTAMFMTHVLKYMSSDPYYASFFPLAGCEGTLKKLLAGTPLQEYVAMKTGSMKGIQCYAGYMLDDDYVPTHSIVIIINDMPGSRATARQAVERMLLSIFSPQQDKPEK